MARAWETEKESGWVTGTNGGVEIKLFVKKYDDNGTDKLLVKWGVPGKNDTIQGIYVQASGKDPAVPSGAGSLFLEFEVKLGSDDSVSVISPGTNP